MKENVFYVYQKEVDWSTLHQGLTVPVSIQVKFQELLRVSLMRGVTKDIHLILEGETHTVKLVNQKFDEAKYPMHKDILQIRYLPNSMVAQKLRSIFQVSYDYLKNIKAKQKGKQTIVVPHEIKEYLILYSTDVPDTFWAECLTSEDFQTVSSAILAISEEEFELDSNYERKDSTARIDKITQLVKVRRLDRSIGDSLKLLYHYKCQICDCNFGENYGSHIVETHHIEPFTISLNNNAENLIIVCPNHHRVIHEANPTFDRTNLLLLYPNGYKELVRLNQHL